MCYAASDTDLNFTMGNETVSIPIAEFLNYGTTASAPAPAPMRAPSAAPRSPSSGYTTPGTSNLPGRRLFSGVSAAGTASCSCMHIVLHCFLNSLMQLIRPHSYTQSVARDGA